MRVSACLYALVLSCVVALAGCGETGPLGPPDPGSRSLGPAEGTCDPITIPC